jgi:hypothetical protein
VFERKKQDKQFSFSSKSAKMLDIAIVVMDMSQNKNWESKEYCEDS